MMALVTGRDCGEQLDLFACFDSLGYAVPAMDEYAAVMHGDFAAKNMVWAVRVCAVKPDAVTHVLLVDERARHQLPPRAILWLGGVGRLCARLYLSVNDAQPHYDALLSCFMLVHSEDNHCADTSSSSSTAI